MIMLICCTWCTLWRHVESLFEMLAGYDFRTSWNGSVLRGISKCVYVALANRLQRCAFVRHGGLCNSANRHEFNDVWCYRQSLRVLHIQIWCNADSSHEHFTWQPACVSARIMFTGTQMMPRTLCPLRLLTSLALEINEVAFVPLIGSCKPLASRSLRHVRKFPKFFFNRTSHVCLECI